MTYESKELAEVATLNALQGMEGSLRLFQRVAAQYPDLIARDAEDLNDIAKGISNLLAAATVRKAA